MSGNAHVGLLELGERVRLLRMKICLEREVELGEMDGERKRLVGEGRSGCIL